MVQSHDPTEIRKKIFRDEAGRGAGDADPGWSAISILPKTIAGRRLPPPTGTRWPAGRAAVQSAAWLVNCRTRNKAIDRVPPANRAFRGKQQELLRGNRSGRAGCIGWRRRGTRRRHAAADLHTCVVIRPSPLRFRSALNAGARCAG